MGYTAQWEAWKPEINEKNGKQTCQTHVGYAGTQCITIARHNSVPWVWQHREPSGSEVNKIFLKAWPDDSVLTVHTLQERPLINFSLGILTALISVCEQIAERLTGKERCELSTLLANKDVVWNQVEALNISLVRWLGYLFIYFLCVLTRDNGFVLLTNVEGVIFV